MPVTYSQTKSVVHIPPGATFRSVTLLGTNFPLQHGMEVARVATTPVKVQVALEGGTAGLAAASGHAAQMLVFQTLMEPGGEFISARQLYGGSVNAKNVGEIVAQEDVDGALVGGASLDGEQFATLSAIAAGGPLP